MKCSLERFFQTRSLTKRLTQKLSVEDQLLQSMPDASPTKWHLAHTTWFFDTFVLKPRGAHVAADTSFEYLFNSYYNQVGPQYTRAKRGLISRPALEDVWQYRHALEEKMSAIWQELTDDELVLIELGIHHEQQHQELMVTDIKHALSFNPQFPALVKHTSTANTIPPAIRWQSFPAGEYQIGCRTEQPISDEFCFDNERPQHRIWLNGFQLASRPVSNAEFLEFIEDGGYREPRLWLSEGWAWVQNQNARAPLYWHYQDDWHVYTLAGLQPLNDAEPASHLNYFEATAFATWAGKRLPTEQEWEVAAQNLPIKGNFLNPEVLHPQTMADADTPLAHMFGDIWEWTQSAYLPYPGYKTPAGAVGEYNGKFMVNQWVLRGGSCATPGAHIRASYRNFFPVTANWQFSGVRLADDLS